MPARFRLRSQRLTLSENDVERTILDMLRYRGWIATRNHCGRWRSMDGRRVITLHEPGYPDWTLHRPAGPGMCEYFHLEAKASRARTNNGTFAAQEQWAENAAHLGELVCRIPDRCDDPIGWFSEWYRGNFK